MLTKQIVFNPEAREKLIKGVNIIGDAVGGTLGPKGQWVVIENQYSTNVTKDGVTVANTIKLEDPIENMGAQLVRQAASKTVDAAGDGTTTSTVLTQALVNVGASLLDKYSPVVVRRGFEKALQDTLKKVTKLSRPVDSTDIQRIATISANNDYELGALINEAFTHASASGLITVEDSKTMETYVKTVEGSHIDRGFFSHLFITDTAKQRCELEKPLFLITDQKISHTDDVLPAMSLALEQKRTLVVICDEIDSSTLSIMALNHASDRLKSVVIKAPAFGERRLEVLMDLCALTSANLITKSKALSLRQVTLEDLGSAEKITVTKDESVIIAPNRNEEEITGRIGMIQQQLVNYPDAYNQEKLNERLARMEGRVAVIYVGAATEAEMKEKKDRIDDALRATKAAAEKGYIPGGGVALLKIAYGTPTTTEIEKAFYEALKFPSIVIASNAGADPNEVLSKFENEGLEYNALRDEYTKSLSKQGVIDPALVLEKALVNAVSAACMVLLSSTAIYPIDRTPAYQPGPIQ